MKLALRATALALAAGFALATAGCGVVPLPADSRQAANASLYPSMELIVEFRMGGMHPYLPANTKGPEMDLVPVFIPMPEYPRQYGWLFFPALETAAGRPLLQKVNMYGTDAAIFGVELDAGKTVHAIDLSANSSNLSGQIFDSKTPGLPFARIAAFPLNEGRPCSRLAVVTQITGYGTIPYPYVYTFEPFDRCISDLSTSTRPFIASDYVMNTQFGPRYDFSNNLFAENSYITHSDSATPWSGHAYNIRLAIPLPDRSAFDLAMENDTYDILDVVRFAPEANTDEASSFNSPTQQTNNTATTTSNTFSYGAVDIDSTPNRFLRSVMRTPPLSGYDLQILPIALGSTYIERQIPYPIVRCLLDGTLLALHGQKWCTAAVDAAGNVSYGADIETGTLVFDYDYKDAANVHWLVFSEALLRPGAAQTGNDSDKSNADLVMRAWRVRKDLLIK